MSAEASRHGNVLGRRQSGWISGQIMKTPPQGTLVEGPDIRELTRHLAECPPIFLEEPVQPSGQGGVHVHAVLSDLLARMGAPRLSETEALLFRYADKKAVRTDRNRLRIALVGAWLFSHRALRGLETARRLRHWLGHELGPLAGLIPVEDLVRDSDRREEFARLCLAALDMRPRGESDSQAQNRLAALSSVERQRVIAEARAAEERARQVREELERKRREEAEAASTYSNE